MTLSDIVQRSDTTPGRIFDSTVIVLILVSVITVTIDTLPTLSPGVRTVLSWSEIVIVGLFTIEYGLRVGTAPRKLQYVFSFPWNRGSGSNPAVLSHAGRRRPACPAGTAAFSDRADPQAEPVQRGVGPVREGNGPREGGDRTFRRCRDRTALPVGWRRIWYFEHEAQPEAFASILHSLWWATATLTTVGYGDVYPVTMGGKLFTFVILMCGLGIVAVPAGLVAAALSQVRREKSEGEPQ